MKQINVLTIPRKTKLLELKDFLDQKSDQFNRPGFIEHDPISIPHSFTKRQDIEISGLFASLLAWGQRVTIIRKCKELLLRMDNDPHQFILHHSESDLKTFEDFRHRTFNGTDALYFITFLRWFYKQHQSLEEAFLVNETDDTVEKGIINFHRLFFSLADLPGENPKACRHSRAKIYLQTTYDVPSVDGQERRSWSRFWTLVDDKSVSINLPL